MATRFRDLLGGGKERPEGGIVQHTVGNALVVHSEDAISPEAQSLALAMIEDAENDVVVLDLGDGMPITAWESVAVVLPRRRRGIRLVACGRHHNSAAMAGQWLSERLNRTVIAPDGELIRGSAGALFVHSTPGSGWIRFRPGRPPTWDAKRYPTPLWDRAAIDTQASSATGEIEPIPAGVWIHSTRNPEVVEFHRQRLAAYVPCRPDTMTVLLGCPGTPALSMDDVVRFWRGLDEENRERVRFAQFGDVRMPEGEAFGQALADLLNTSVVCYTGMPIGSPQKNEIRTVLPDGTLGWAPFALELVYTPRAHPNSRARRPAVLTHRPPLNAAEEIAPRIYWFAPGAVVEVVQTGLWVRSTEEPRNAEQVRAAMLDAEGGVLVFDDTIHSATGRMRELAVDLAARVSGMEGSGSALMPASVLVPGAKPASRAQAVIDLEEETRKVSNVAPIPVYAEAAPPAPVAVESMMVAEVSVPVRLEVSAPVEEEQIQLPAARQQVSVPLPTAPPAVSSATDWAPVAISSITPGAPGEPEESAPSVAAEPEPETGPVLQTAPTVLPATVPAGVSEPEPPSMPVSVSVPEPTVSVSVSEPEPPTVSVSVSEPEPPTAPVSVGVPEAPTVPVSVSVPEPPTMPAGFSMPEPPTAPVNVSVPEPPTMPVSVSVPEPPTMPAGFGGSIGAETTLPAAAAATVPGPVPASPVVPAAPVGKPVTDVSEAPGPPAVEAPEPMVSTLQPVPAGPRADVVWQPVPSAGASALLRDKGLNDERAWLRRTLSREFDVMASSVSRIMSEHPGMQGSGLSTEDVLTDSVALRLYLTARGAGVDAGLRSGRKGPHVPFARCVVSGLSRMSSFRGTTIYRITPTEAEWELYEQRRLVTDWGFVNALTQPCSTEDGDTDVLIWSMTARRTTVLEPEGDEAVEDRVLFLPGTNFKVLDLRRPAAGERGAVLIREIGANEIDDNGKVDSNRVSLDELAVTSLRRSVDRWATAEPRRRIGAGARGRIRTLPGLDRTAQPGSEQKG